MSDDGSCCLHDLTRCVGALIPAQSGHFVLLDSPQIFGDDLDAARKALPGRTVHREGWVLLVQRNGAIVEREELPASMPWAVVDAFAEALVRPGALVTTAAAVEGNARGTIYREVQALTLGDLVERYEDSAGALDILLAATGAPVEKAKGKTFNSARNVTRLHGRLQKAHAATVDITIGELVEVAGVTEWAELGMGDAALEIDRMADALNAEGGQLAKRMAAPLLAEAMRTVRDARKWQAKRWGWGPGGDRVPPNGPIKAKLDFADRREVRHIRRSQVNFVTNEFTQRSGHWSDIARRIVAHGHEQGLGTNEIARDLSRWLQVRGGNPHYMRIVAQAYTVRAESYANLSTFKKAGVELARITAVGDEATTDICLYLDGKRIPVGRSLELMEKVNRLDDPQDVKVEQPWLRERIIDKETGRKALFYRNRDGADVRVAEVGGDRAARNRIAEDKLIDHGIGPPPYHGRCRTTLSPIL